MRIALARALFIQPTLLLLGTCARVHNSFKCQEFMNSFTTFYFLYNELFLKLSTPFSYPSLFASCPSLSYYCKYSYLHRSPSFSSSLPLTLPPSFLPLFYHSLLHSFLHSFLHSSLSFSLLLSFAIPFFIPSLLPFLAFFLSNSHLYSLPLFCHSFLPSIFPFLFDLFPLGFLRSLHFPSQMSLQIIWIWRL